MRTELLIVAVAVLLALLYIAANNPFVVEKTRGMICTEDGIALPERTCDADDQVCAGEAIEHKKSCSNIAIVEESALGTFRAEMREFGGHCLVTITALDSYTDDIRNKTMECVVPLGEARLLYEQPAGKKLYGVFPYSPGLLVHCTGDLAGSLSDEISVIYDSKCSE